jgi:hypothetical protein
MIKQYWNIIESEKDRILSLHKNATKKMYLNENDTNFVAKNRIELYFNFPSGKYSSNTITNNDQTINDEINQKLNTITDFLKKYKFSKITISLEAGESAVPNMDNEVNPPVALNRGELATKRAQTIYNILNNYFNTLVKSRVISEVPEMTQPTVVYGKATTKGPEADKEQYIKLIITANAAIDYSCLVGLEIMIDYKKEWCSQDPTRCHNCDLAQFQVLLNGIVLPVINRTDSIVDLNNKSTNGGDKFSKMVITEELANEIVQKTKNGDIYVQIRCMSEPNCHDDALHFTVRNKDIEWSDFISISNTPPTGDNPNNTSNTSKPISSRLAKNSVVQIMRMDKCGKLLDKSIRKIN